MGRLKPATMSVLVLSRDDVLHLLPPVLAVETQREAYRAAALGQGRLTAFARAVDAADDSLSFALTGQVRGSTGMVGKVGIQLPANSARGLPSIHAVVFVFDPVTGVPLACLNGAALTVLRTSAGLAAAGQALAPREATTLGVLGVGEQGRSVVRMMAAVRDLTEVVLWSPTPSRRERAAAVLSAELGIEVLTAGSPREVVERSQILATCSRSREPLVRGAWTWPGQTVLTIGCYDRDRQEVDLAVSRSARTFVDDRGKCLEHCGPILAAIEAGVLRAAELTPIGAVLAGQAQGRRHAEEVLVFHSMGMGLQDATAAWAVYEGAVEQGVGAVVDL